MRAEREFRIEFAPPAKLPFSLIRLNHVEAGYGKDAVILHNVGFGRKRASASDCSAPTAPARPPW